MKIAVIGANSISAKFGGIDRYCQELYPRIVERGHEVDLYVQPNRHHASCFSSFVYQRMKVITLPGRSRFSFIHSALSSIFATFGNYDVIHFHGIAAAWLAWFPKMFSYSSTVITCHRLESSPVQSSRLTRWLLCSLEKVTINYVDETIVTSAELADYFWRRYRVYSQHIADAPSQNCSGSDRFNYREVLGLDCNRYILYVGKFEPNRGLALAIEAFQKLQLPNWKLVLAGDISRLPQHTNKLLQLAQEENIIFTGEISDRSLAELVQGADISIDPATDDSLGSSNAVLTAMQLGIPVVVSDTATHCRLVGRDRGLLFSAGQSDSLSAQLKYAVSHPDLLLAMAKKAQTYIAINHNWDKVIYKNLFIYLQLTATRPLASPHRSFERQ